VGSERPAGRDSDSWWSLEVPRVRGACARSANRPLGEAGAALRRYAAHIADDEVTLEGGDRRGQPVPFSAMTHVGAGKYVLHDKAGVYRHDEESAADFRDGQRLAVLEPSEPEPSGRHVRLVDGGSGELAPPAPE
jgi:hypothetical protein